MINQSNRIVKYELKINVSYYIVYMKLLFKSTSIYYSKFMFL